LARGILGESMDQPLTAELLWILSRGHYTSRLVSIPEPVTKQMSSPLDDDELIFDRSARDVINLGNTIVEDNPDADEWEVASGILAGAVQFWLFSRQPCDDPMCESCAEISTAAQRLGQLLEEVNGFAAESDYFHSPSDTNVGSA
jgi:hypothetical protein